MFGMSIFRYRKRTETIITVFLCFAESEKRRLHPTEVAREAGMQMGSAVRLMDQIHEIFLKLPRGADGLTYYALRPSVSAQPPDDVIRMVNRKAMRETILFYSWISLITLMLVVVALASYPSMKLVFGG